MAAKRRTKTLVPESGEVIATPSKPSRLGGVTTEDATDFVTLASLAGEVAELRLEVNVIVEWLDTFEQRLAGED